MGGVASEIAGTHLVMRLEQTTSQHALVKNIANLTPSANHRENLRLRQSGAGYDVSVIGSICRIIRTPERDVLLPI